MIGYRIITSAEEVDNLPAGSILAVEKHYDGAVWARDAAVRRPEGDWLLTESNTLRATLLLKSHFQDPTLVFLLVYTPTEAP